MIRQDMLDLFRTDSEPSSGNVYTTLRIKEILRVVQTAVDELKTMEQDSLDDIIFELEALLEIEYEGENASREPRINSET